MIKINGNLITDLIAIKSIKVLNPQSRIERNNYLRVWSNREVKGNLIINANILGESEEEKENNLDLLLSKLGNGVVQVDNNYYDSDLLVGVNKNIDKDNFYLLFSFGKNDTGEGIKPILPKNINTTVSGKLAKIEFERVYDDDTVAVEIDGKTISAEANSNEIVVAFTEENKTFYGSIYAVSPSGVRSVEMPIIINTESSLVTPSMPTGLTINSVLGRVVEIAFVKGANASLTEIMIGDKTFKTYDNKFKVMLDAYESNYNVKARSYSIDGVLSEWTSEIVATTGSIVVPNMPTLNDVVVNGTTITFFVTHGENSSSTELIFNGVNQLFNTPSISIDIEEFNKTVLYKLRSISEDGIYSDFTPERTVVTDRQYIYPSQPTFIQALSVNGKTVTIGFNKGENAVATEIMIDGSVISTENEEVTVLVSEFNTEYGYKLRSKSVTGDYSPWTEELKVVSDIDALIPPVPTDIVTEVLGRACKVSFTKAIDVAFTEVQVLDNVFATELDSIYVELPAFDTEYVLKIRNVSAEYGYSEYVTVNVRSGSNTEGANLKSTSLIYNPFNSYSNYGEVKKFINGAEIDIEELNNMNAERYSVSGSIIKGKLN